MPAPVSILFVSRRDSLRSVLASSCLAHVARGKFHPSSCGVPGAIARERHPVALLTLARARIPVAHGAPRDWTRITQRLVRAPEIVIVLDSQVAADLPSFPEQPETAVWPLEDLLADDRNPDQAAVLAMLHRLRRRLDILSNLPLRGVDRGLLRSDLRDLGRW